MRVLMQQVAKSVSATGVALSLMVISAAGSFAAEPGQEVFEANCAVCHGLDGMAVLPNAPHFAKGERLEKSDEVLLVSLVDGLNVMPPWKGVLNEQEMKDVIVYVRTLAK